MKTKTITLIMTLGILFLFVNCAGNAADARRPAGKNKINSLVNDFRREEGFEIIKLGSFSMNLLRLAVKFSDDGDMDEDDRKAMKALSGIKAMTVVDYEDAPKSVRDRFTARLDRILAGNELLLEAKDDGETVRIYASPAKDSSMVKDIIIHNPSDGALVCFFGTVDVDLIGELAKQSKNMD